jgi:Ca2+-binding EF-hand superfamily protein
MIGQVLSVLSCMSELVTLDQAKELIVKAFDIFEKFDKNKDGQLSLDELLTAGLFAMPTKV